MADTWQTPLHAAACQNDCDLIDRLASAGADPDALDRFGLTPLARAVALGLEESAQKLLALGCDPEHYGQSGVPPLLLGAVNGMVELVRLLLDHGLHPDAQARPSGLTALMCASQFGHRPVVRLLARRGATIDTTDVRGQTALFHAAVGNRPRTCQLLLKLGAAVDALDKHQETALHQLVKQRLAVNSYRSGLATSRTLVVLLRGGANPHLLDHAGRSCLELALLYRRRDYAHFLWRATAWALGACRRSAPTGSEGVAGMPTPYPRSCSRRAPRTLG